MKLAYKIEHLEYWAMKAFKEEGYKPWRCLNKSRKYLKNLQHRTWRRWSKRNLEEDSLNPMYNRYHDWEY